MLAGLIESASPDVFIEGYRPGVTERLGLPPDALLSRNPAIVYARLTGYGRAGPLARGAGHDINYVAPGDRARRCAPAPRVLVRRGGSSWLSST